MNSVHDVNPEDISQIKDESADMDMNEECASEEQQVVAEHSLQHTEWPQPLKEPGFLHSSVLQFHNPSIFFNTKIRSKKSFSSTEKVDTEGSGYSMDTAATPFDRYLLSKEIMELLSNPVKKEILDMENPVVKAVYETVFCDPTEFGNSDKDRSEPVELEKVFTEGEFIPFNPLVISNHAYAVCINWLLSIWFCLF